MRWLARHLVPTAIVVCGFAVVTATFVFARPQARTARTEVVVHMSGERHVTRASVVAAFEAQRIELVPGPALGSGRIFVDRHPGDSFTVTIFGPDAVVHFGTTGPKAAVEKRIGNVEVFYGGEDRRFIRRIAAAVAALG